jgi:hypothetical protein
MLEITNEHERLRAERLTHISIEHRVAHRRRQSQAPRDAHDQTVKTDSDICSLNENYLK